MILSFLVALVAIWMMPSMAVAVKDRKFGGRTSYHGKAVNWAVWYAMQAAMKMLATPHFGGERDWVLMWQGCWSRSVGASAGTHGGTGTFDISLFNWKNRLWVFRLLGFAIWMRPAIRGLWVQHMHGVMAGDGGAARLAIQQVASFWKRPSRDGLRGNRVDKQLPKMLCRPLFVYPLKEAGRPGKLKCVTSCHAYKQQTTQAPRYGDQINVGDILEVVAITRDRDTGKYWGVTATGRCIYRDNFTRAS